jgi:hypothetical protein
MVVEKFKKLLLPVGVDFLPEPEISGDLCTLSTTASDTSLCRCTWSLLHFVLIVESSQHSLSLCKTICTPLPFKVYHFVSRVQDHCRHIYRRFICHCIVLLQQIPCHVDSRTKTCFLPIWSTTSGLLLRLKLH